MTMGPVTTTVGALTTTVGAAAVGAAAVGLATVGVVTVGGNLPPIFSAHWQTRFHWVISWYLGRLTARVWLRSLQSFLRSSAGSAVTHGRSVGHKIWHKYLYIRSVCVFCVGSGNRTIDVMLIESPSATAWQALPFLCQDDLWTPLRTAHPATSRMMGAAGESVTWAVAVQSKSARPLAEENETSILPF